MAIFLITNRTVNNGVIAADGREAAEPTFRVARYISSNNPAAVQPLHERYELLGDLSERGYFSLYSADSPIPIAERKGTAALFADLYDDMVSTEGFADVLFVIHGFNNDLEHNFRHIEQLKCCYIDNPECSIKHIVFLSWPSRGALFEYRDDLVDARTTGRQLGAILEKLHRFYVDTFARNNRHRCGQRLHLLAHSMGNQVLSYALQTVEDSQLFQLFEEAVLMNADVDSGALGKHKPLRKIERLANRVHVFTHRNDQALMVSSSTKNSSRRLGRVGPDRDTQPDNCFVVDTTAAEVFSRLSLTERVMADMINHAPYVKREAVIRDLTDIFAGKDHAAIASRRPREGLLNWFELIEEIVS